MDPNTLQLWLWLSQQNPRTLSPPVRAQLDAIHQLMNQHMAADPLGLFSLTPPPPSLLQQLAWLHAQRPQVPFFEAFPPPSFQQPFVGRDRHLKSGVEPLSTIEPMTETGGMQWRL